METRTIKGHTVHLALRADADLVMLVRLAGRDGGVWDGIWPGLAKSFSVANVDLGSPHDIDANPHKVLQHFADTIVGIGFSLAARPFHILGWTGGAQIALQAATRHPRRIASMTLVTPLCAAGEMRQVAAGLEIVETILRSGDWNTYAKHWFLAGFSDRFIQDNFDRIEEMVRQRVAGDHFMSFDIDMAMSWMRALRQNWVTPAELAAIAIPTLILAGGQNRWHAGPSPEMARELHERIPKSRLHMMDALGPLLLLEAAADAGDVIGEFLRSCAAARSAGPDRPRMPAE
ncbi:MAG: alpha/beta hydrolase [Geminicoccaceae bacterium]